MSAASKWFLILLRCTAVAVAMVCQGCGDGRTPVQGEVSFDGKPVQEGTICFEPADGRGATAGGKITAGKYQLVGNAAPLPGKKIVRISGFRKTGRRIHAGPPAASNVMIDEIERLTPDIYNTRTTLSCNIEASGNNHIDFHLTSP